MAFSPVAKWRGGPNQAGSDTGSQHAPCRAAQPPAACLSAQTAMRASELNRAWLTPTMTPSPLRRRWEGRGRAHVRAAAAHSRPAPRPAALGAASCRDRAIRRAAPGLAPGTHPMPPASLPPPNRKLGLATSTTPTRATGIPSSVPRLGVSFRMTGLPGAGRGQAGRQPRTLWRGGAGGGGGRQPLAAGPEQTAAAYPPT